MYKQNIKKISLGLGLIFIGISMFIKDDMYEELWKRECEAYKDLSIKTGNWDRGEA